MKNSQNRNGYIIVSECGVIVQYHLDKMVFDELIELKLEMMADSQFNPTYPFIIDLRSAQMDNTLDEIVEYANWLKTNFVLEGKRKLAIITSTPRQAAISSLFSHHGRPGSLNYELFTDVGRAIGWLGIPQEKYGLLLEVIDSIDTID